ncbi:hypothetical protein BJP36_40325 [Moorena producens JHB]|uniref:Uncharacterized protein n=1 Tax=Moorena producens (strain JHB) TaxID=1454205 RepID=A0A9Q9SS59_MOOP1|nr:hypothetical protein [Moorena producens]WAN68621.1 hypothetical protein BJP36_40325 [Moorena producens JHB]
MPAYNPAIDVGWAVQQTNQISSPSHPKALPTNCLEIETGKMPVLPRCPFHHCPARMNDKGAI